MKIATLNIDWANAQKSKNHIYKIEKALNTFIFDILIITEGVDLDLPAYNFIYKTQALPIDKKYEEVDYLDYLKGTSAYRIIIYSKYPSLQTFEVADNFTSICEHFNTSVGLLTVYATIIGTQFKKQPYAKKELENCINDCLRISSQTNSLCLTGDLNTSFLEDEKDFQISNDTTKLLIDICHHCKLNLTTQKVKNNIDHIFLSQQLLFKYVAVPKIFVEKNELSDHQGIVLDIKEKYIG